MTLIRISALLALAAAAACAQSAVPSSKPDEVVLDLVVKDKKGKPIKDLSAADVELSDNGSKQNVTSFRLIDGVNAVTNGSSAPLDAIRQTRLVVIAFEQLDEDARRQAKQVANELLKTAAAPNINFAVVGINQQLVLLQPFTTDRALLKKAIDEAVSGSQMIRFAEQSDANKAKLREATGTTDVSKKLAQVALDMTRDTMSTNEPERATIFSILSLCRGLGTMPGRKSIVHISTGLNLPTYLDEPFRSISSTANRANVSIYTVDARGVQLGRQNEGIINAVGGAAKDTQSDVSATGRDASFVTKDQIMASDRVEAGMRKNVQIPLREMSETTGGFMVADTNSFSKPMQQLADEINTYYEAVYNPGITNFDGQFRKTEVKVGRNDVKVIARNGYFALPADVRAMGLMPFEAVLMNALTSNPLPRDVQFRSAAIKFAASAQGAHEEVLIEVPLANLTFREDPTAKTFDARVSVMAVLKDPKGEVVQKLSRDLPLHGPIAQAASVKQGNFLYKDHFTVPPGRYTLETAVIDRVANKIGTKKASLVIPVKAAGVSMSSITLVRRYQPKAAGIDPAEDFEFQGGLVTPTLGNTITNGKGSMMSMFFVVYPDPAIAEKPSLVIEYIKDGQVAGRGAVELPPADSKGRIPYVMSSSPESMPPGSYEIRAVVKQGTSATEDRAFVTVEAPAPGSGS